MQTVKLEVNAKYRSTDDKKYNCTRSNSDFGSAELNMNDEYSGDIMRNVYKLINRQLGAPGQASAKNNVESSTLQSPAQGRHNVTNTYTIKFFKYFFSG